MGNLTVANLKKRVEGGRRKVVVDITYSASYATNGDSFVAADQAAILGALGMAEAADFAKVEVFDAEMGSDGTSSFLDRANKKIKAFSGRAEVANATNLSAIVVRCEFEAPAVTG